MKNVSIIQSAITHFDWSFSGASCASASAGSASAQSDDDGEREQAPPHCWPGTSGGMIFCETGGSFSPRAFASAHARFSRSR